MKSLQQYSIPYTGLKLGIHQFEFEVDEAFFSEFEYSLVKSGKLKVDLDMEKQETMMLLHFRISGEIMLGCDVCLGDYPYMVSIDERQIAKFTDNIELEEDTEEIVVLTKNENEINVATLIYEYINLAVPYINRCGDEAVVNHKNPASIGPIVIFNCPREPRRRQKNRLSRADAATNGGTPDRSPVRCTGWPPAPASDWTGFHRPEVE